MPKEIKDNGWIALHRKLLNNPIANKPNYLAVWIYLLLSANHEDQYVIWNNKKTLIKRGSFIGSISQISKQFNLSTGTVSLILDYLISEKMVEKSSNMKFTLFTIVNYDIYQKGSEKKTENKLKTNRKQVENKLKQTIMITMNNNDNKEDNERNKDTTKNTTKNTSPKENKVNKFIEIFNTVVGTNHKPLDKYKKKLDYLLKEYSFEEIEMAIKNARNNSFLMGDNDKGKRYLTPEYILRPEKLDEWLNAGSNTRKKLPSGYYEKGGLIWKAGK